MNPFIVADSMKCIGCRTCEVACVVAHQEQQACATVSREGFKAAFATRGAWPVWQLPRERGSRGKTFSLASPVGMPLKRRMQRDAAFRLAGEVDTALAGTYSGRGITAIHFGPRRLCIRGEYLTSLPPIRTEVAGPRLDQPAVAQREGQEGRLAVEQRDVQLGGQLAQMAGSCQSPPATTDDDDPPVVGKGRMKQGQQPGRNQEMATIGHW